MCNILETFILHFWMESPVASLCKSQRWRHFFFLLNKNTACYSSSKKKPQNKQLWIRWDMLLFKNNQLQGVVNQIHVQLHHITTSLIISYNSMVCLIYYFENYHSWWHQCPSSTLPNILKYYSTINPLLNVFKIKNIYSLQ